MAKFSRPFSIIRVRQVSEKRLVVRRSFLAGSLKALRRFFNFQAFFKLFQ